LAFSPLRWALTDREKEMLTFEQVIQSGDEFIRWVEAEKEDNSKENERSQRGKRRIEKDRKNDPLKSNNCRATIPSDYKALLNQQLSLFPIEKKLTRCGHGGHTDICRGMGKLREYDCIQIMKLTQEQKDKGCNLMTYTNGECYLHDTKQTDYWEGDCVNRYSYSAAPLGKY
jgi:hypothetical protein